MWPYSAVRLAACLVPFAIVGCAGSSPPIVAPEIESGFDWQLPAGFPTPSVPPDNPMSEEKVQLGRHLFYDQRLSGNGTASCASCHRQELAFTDGLARALGSTDELHPRSAMSLANVAYSRTLNWADAELDRLEHQMLVPMFNREPVELGLAGREREVVDRLRAVELYREMFALAFPAEPEPISIPNLIDAVACFERTLLSGDSAYDRLVFGGERAALSSRAWSGMRLFFSERLRCFECHSGLTFSAPVIHREAPEAEPEFHNTGLYALPPDGSYPAPNRGLYESTSTTEDMGRFKAPTLRNVAVTAPYMHDGSLATLEEVVEHYAAGGRLLVEGPLAGDGRNSPHKSELVAGFELTDEERDQLIAFLESLTDERFLIDERFSDPWRKETHPADR